jgi:hypothetical protein
MYTLLNDQGLGKRDRRPYIDITVCAQDRGAGNRNKGTQVSGETILNGTTTEQRLGPAFSCL